MFNQVDLDNLSVLYWWVVESAEDHPSEYKLIECYESLSSVWHEIDSQINPGGDCLIPVLSDTLYAVSDNGDIEEIG